jgi:hypothetical protein
MNKRLLKRIFPFIALLLLIPWPVAYGYEASGASAARELIQITTATPSAAPSWEVFGKAIGGAQAGDLFYIDATDDPADINVTLYLTNTQELVHNYRYLILKVGLYSKVADGDWQKATGSDSKPLTDTFITLLNGQVSFTIPGYTRYKVTIEEGSFYCYGAKASKGSLSPNFYLEIEQQGTMHKKEV